MLRRSLDLHPNIVCLSESFNPDYSSANDYFTENTPANEVLERYIFAPRERKIRAVGFCLHRTGASFGNWPDLWQTLAGLPDLHIISLRRRNLLRRHVSFQNRPRRGVPWRPDPEPLVLQTHELIADFEHQTSRNQEFDQLFEGHPLLKIEYEDLCADFESSTRRVQDFLKVPYQRLHPVTAKLTTCPLDQSIQNYEQLKRELAATPWAGFFDA